jgi:dTDP-4-dehydrorhamnose 3,5-epimerase
MRILPTTIPDVLIIEPDIFGDQRGFFYETYSEERYRSVGIDSKFCQDNLSLSEKNVLRGLHYQHQNTQGKLVYVLKGEVLDVAVDIRLGSPTFGKYFSSILSSENKLQMWVPPGFAHGFCVISEEALFCYKCTDYYNAEAEISIKWDDPNIAINWPNTSPILSKKDMSAPLLNELPEDRLPLYKK